MKLEIKTSDENSCSSLSKSPLNSLNSLIPDNKQWVSIDSLIKYLKTITKKV